MRGIHRIVALLMVAGGALHAGSTPAAFEGLSREALWFASGGLAMILLGFLNLALATSNAQVVLTYRLTQGGNLLAAVLMALLYSVTVSVQPILLLILIGAAAVAGWREMRAVRPESGP